jgi:hypothetical protein
MRGGFVAHLSHAEIDDWHLFLVWIGCAGRDVARSSRARSWIILDLASGR